CKFPEHWSGSWFQKFVPDYIHISRNNISEKGICRKNVGEKYLIENRSEKCFRCLVINERHPNILQYKETPSCYNKISFDICNYINGDAPLYSLFRVNTSPIKCPFKGPYSFSYSKGINECKDPLSEIDECTDDKRLLLKFKACADIPGSESRVEELECVAEWKEGSYKYLVGRLHHNSANSDDDKFRCFVIEKNNTDPVESYTIGQSGDASCDGLYAPRDGLRAFKIRKSSQIEPKCDFPSWLSGRRWKTLDNRLHYDFTVPQTFTVLNERHDVNRNAKCIESDDVSFLSQQFNTSRFVVHTTLGCKSGFACMYAYLREDRIVELQIGRIVSHFADACSVYHFNPAYASFTTLTTFDDYTKECSLKGLYSIRTKVPFYDKYDQSSRERISNSTLSRMISFLDSRFMCQERSLKLKSNCDDPDQFQFSCASDNRVKNFKCRGGWRENSTQMFLVSFLEKFNYEYCITLNTETNEIKMVRNSHFCYRESNSLPSSSSDQSVKFPMELPKTLNEESVSFTLISDGSCSQQSSAPSTLHLGPAFSLSMATVLLLLMLLNLRISLL
ncbi:hypothetical protein TYRP_008116, partial [Tyrophagus putrescentiae]